MEQSLKNRLKYGSMMMAFMVAGLWFDHAAQRWTRSPELPYGVGGIGLLALLLFVAPIAVTELAALFAAERVRPYRTVSGAGCWLLIIHAFLTQFPWFERIAASSLAFIITFVMISAALRRAWGKKTEEAILLMAGTVLATLYLGGLAWFLMALRVKRAANVEGTTLVVLMILLVVKSTDIGAYFGGRALGRHKLIPWLSPGKTWEGLACGMFVSGLVGTAFAVGINNFLWWQGSIFGVVIGGIGQAGDLLESLMKRDAEVKDSSRLIPGFGGILDVIDSPLFASPFAYLLFSLFHYVHKLPW
ncbi:MAG TPA: phosphatidate cytidylyltransferase [Tepidisphaeraceae bacterium]|jgi:phosphatidate cytidylyltransferase|nr:phosphatidate cytidylyltransferase [Tepidisphaeraceae bacterium]